MDQPNTNPVMPINERLLMEQLKRSLSFGYGYQDQRIAFANRFAASFVTNRKHNVMLSKKIIMDDGKPSTVELIITKLTSDYERIMAAYGLANNEFPSKEVFYTIVNDGIILEQMRNYADFVAIQRYSNMVADEKSVFDGEIPQLLLGAKIYTDYLCGVDGVGPTIAALLIANIDPYAATYASSFIKYCGLDVVRIDSNGNADNRARGGYAEHLVPRQIFDEEGKVVKEFNALSFNKMLKSKLLGVLASGFVKCTKTYVNGVKSTSASRAKMAVDMGFVMPATEDVNVRKKAVLTFLRESGFVVEVVRSKYGQVYDDYKIRKTNQNTIASNKREAMLARAKLMSEGVEKDALFAEAEAIVVLTPKHIDNMSKRPPVQRFLTDLYYVWRTMLGLPTTLEYNVRMLRDGVGHNGDMRTIPELVQALMTDAKYVELTAPAVAASRVKTKVLKPKDFDIEERRTVKKPVTEQVTSETKPKRGRKPKAE